MDNVAMPGVTDKNESYRGFIISWQEPPMMDRWTANIASDIPNLLVLMKQSGSAVIDGRDRGDMIATSKNISTDC